MSTMYFAKVSMSSDIYKFYEDINLYNQFLNKLYKIINDERQIRDEYGRIYKLNSLMFDNDNMTVTGRYSVIFDGKVEKYDWTKNEPKSRKEQDMSSTVNFFFDVKTELIAYTTSRDFGYQQFTKMFKVYIDEALGDENIKVAVELLIDEEDLKKKINDLKKIEEISFKIIPPNPPNIEEFNAIFGDRADAVYTSGTTQYTEIYELKDKKSERGVKVVEYFDKIISVIKDGYGSVTARGVNSGDLPENISSKENTPKKHSINTSRKDALPYIKEEGERVIKNIIAKKNQFKQ